MPLDDKQRQMGTDNFNDAVRITRRQMLSAGLVIPTAAAMYWGYDKIKGEPVKAGLIGTGNQGCYAHISQSNPDYIEFVAFSDIRPSNQARARKAFADLYGADKANKIQLYEDYNQLLDRTDIELVIVALPLHLHAPATIAALEKGKHVLCEKLMAKYVRECKDMINAADKAGKYLAIGHQRHYSYMYANALELIKQGLIGDIRHIHAYWHRNQAIRDSWHPEIPAEDKGVDALKYGYGRAEDSPEERVAKLVRWRLHNEYGGGLMVELGSHQLDAASIFLRHKKPVALAGTGVDSYFVDERSIYDPKEEAHAASQPTTRPTYPYNTDNAVVTYSSISTNAFDGYGEQVNGTKATLIVEKELRGYVFQESLSTDPKDIRMNPEVIQQDLPAAPKSIEVSWAENRIGEPNVKSGSTAAWGAGAVGITDTLTSRGYREEQEHLAWLIRHVGKPNLNDPKTLPRCHGRVGLADAVVALCSNIAMDRKQRIVLDPNWFDPSSKAVP
jgi:predicted dehydrogenase